MMSTGTVLGLAHVIAIVALALASCTAGSSSPGATTAADGGPVGAGGRGGSGGGGASTSGTGGAGGAPECVLPVDGGCPQHWTVIDGRPFDKSLTCFGINRILSCTQGGWTDGRFCWIEQATGTSYRTERDGCMVGGLSAWKRCPLGPSEEVVTQQEHPDCP